VNIKREKKRFRSCFISHKGFSLIEVLISLVIFSIGIMAVFSLHIGSVNGFTSSRIHTESVYWCQDRIERLMMLNYDPDNIHSDLNPGVHYETDPSGTYVVSWTVESLKEKGKEVKSILFIKDIGTLKKNQVQIGTSFSMVKISGN